MASSLERSVSIVVLCSFATCWAMDTEMLPSGNYSGMHKSMSGEIAIIDRHEWRTPQLLMGDCSTVWTSSFSKYKMPYRVRWLDQGFFQWWAPYKNGKAVEVGEGMYLSSPLSTANEDGSWETHYFGANRFTPDPANSTNCCCEYVGGRGTHEPRVLADYCVANVPNSAHRPMAEVCAPYIRECPSSNATAHELMGNPFIEVYATCERANDAFFAPFLLFGGFLVALLTMCVLSSIKRKVGNLTLSDLEAEVEADAYQFMANEEFTPKPWRMITASTMTPCSSEASFPHSLSKASLLSDDDFKTQPGAWVRSSSDGCSLEPDPDDLPSFGWFRTKTDPTSTSRNTGGLDQEQALLINV